MSWYCLAWRGIIFFDTLAVIHLKQLEHVAHAPGNPNHPLDHRQCVQHLQIIMQLGFYKDWDLEHFGFEEEGKLKYTDHGLRWFCLAPCRRPPSGWKLGLQHGQGSQTWNNWLPLKKNFWANMTRRQDVSYMIYHIWGWCSAHPVTSVAAPALCLCISLAPVRFNLGGNQNSN